MNAPARNPADIPGAEAAFFKRQRIVRAAELVLFILPLRRHPPLEGALHSDGMVFLARASGADAHGSLTAGVALVIDAGRHEGPP